MPVRNSLLMLAGAVVVAVMAMLWGVRSGEALSDALKQRADEVAAVTGAVDASVDFTTVEGWATRHAMLTPIGEPGEGDRAALAQAIGRIPGVGGVHWTDGTMLAEAGDQPVESLQCQDDVAALLDARTLRFEEGSADMDFGNDELLDEVAAALRPCLGAIIAIDGHTDSSGDPELNLALSRDRAYTVRRELVERGIPGDGLRARGVGSTEPVAGLDPADPANRRIEFSVIAKAALVPTPVDTPSAR